MTSEQIRLATAHLKTAILWLNMPIEATDEEERDDYRRGARKLAREILPILPPGARALIETKL